MLFQKFRPTRTYEFSDRGGFEPKREAVTRETGVRQALTGVAEFLVAGYCGPCRRRSKFVVDYLYGGDIASHRPNYRERLLCQKCGLNSRLRACVGVIVDCIPQRSAVYITEFVTPLFADLSTRFPGVVGSEYLRDGTPSGAVNARGVRHEDLTALSFADASFDAVASFECLEHIPDYKAALRECRRVLRPGGHLFLTAPFINDRQETTVRALVDSESGTIQHLLEPEYHGDPVAEGGVLCFYHFGWSLLDDMKDAGFARASVLVLNDPSRGHVTPEFIFKAVA